LASAALRVFITRIGDPSEEAGQATTINCSEATGRWFSGIEQRLKPNNFKFKSIWSSWGTELIQIN
jgi:hypothetical protein